MVFTTPQGQYRISYHMEDGNPVLTGDQKEVTRKTEYIVKNSGWLERLKHMLQFNSKIIDQPVQVNEEVDMTPEEVQAIVTKALEATNASLAAVQAENVTLKADIVKAQTAISANAESGLAEKRAVVAKEHGEVVANALTGDALDAMFAKCQTAASLLGGMPQVNSSDFKAPTMGEHFGSAK